MEGRLGRFINKVKQGMHLSPRPPVDPWEKYEKRIPGLGDRMLQTWKDHEAGKGITLGADLFQAGVRSDSGSQTAAEVWKRLGEIPGFNDELRQAIKDVDEGRASPRLDDKE